MTARPSLVVVSGPPGAGKTQLARAVALAIGCPAISRDEIKEGMVHAHGPGFTASPGDQLTQRTYPIFFKVIQDLLEGGASVVAEAGFQDTVWKAGLEPLLSFASVRVLRCQVSDATALRRRASRTRPAHVDAGPSVVLPSAFMHLSAGVPTLDIDTEDGYVPVFEDIVTFARG